MSITTPGEITIERAIHGPHPYVILADIHETILVPLMVRDEGDNALMRKIGESHDFLPKGRYYIDDLVVDHVIVLNGEGDEEPNEYEYHISSSGVTLALHISPLGEESPRKIRREIENSIDLRRLDVVYNDQIEFDGITHMDVTDFIEAFR